LSTTLIAFLGTPTGGWEPICGPTGNL